MYGPILAAYSWWTAVLGRLPVSYSTKRAGLPDPRSSVASVVPQGQKTVFERLSCVPTWLETLHVSSFMMAVQLQMRRWTEFCRSS